MLKSVEQINLLLLHSQRYSLTQNNFNVKIFYLGIILMSCFKFLKDFDSKTLFNQICKIL